MLLFHFNIASLLLLLLLRLLSADNDIDDDAEMRQLR